MLIGDKCFVLKHDVKFWKTIIANRLTCTKLNSSNLQTLFCTHRRHMFIANLNDYNDTASVNTLGIVLNRFDVIRLRSDVIRPIT